MKRNSIPTLETSSEFGYSPKNDPKNVQKGSKLKTLLSSATMFDSEFDLGILTSMLPKKDIIDEKPTEWEFDNVISQIIADKAGEERKDFLQRKSQN